MATCTKSHPMLAAQLTDSYKYGNAQQYPSGTTKMVAYGEFQSSFDKDKQDSRLVFYGMRQLINDFIAVPWSANDVDKLSQFLSTHGVLGGYEFPKGLFMKFINENNGYFPIKIEALPEGSVVYPHVPVYQITAEAYYSPLVTFFETLLSHVWYPSTVATLSRKAKQIFIDSFAFANVSKADTKLLINSRLHDFGYRGATCFEQAKIGGTAHLLNFTSSDTTAAAYYAQYELNDGKPVAKSIPTTEHSVMLSYGKCNDHLPGDGPVSGFVNEMAAIQNMVDLYTLNKQENGHCIFACVPDTYDYWNTLFKIFPTLNFNGKKDFTMVWRPDSGDFMLSVLDGLIGIELFETLTGLPGNTIGSAYYDTPDHSINEHKTKFLKFTNFAIIQGRDCVDLQAIKHVLNVVMDPKRRSDRIKQLYEGVVSSDSKKKKSYPVGFLITKQQKKELLKHKVAYSPANVAFGMGGGSDSGSGSCGLLHKVNRDTMSFATGLCSLTVDGKERIVMSGLKTDPDKRSLAGELAVKVVDAEGKDVPQTTVYNSNITTGHYPVVVPKSKMSTLVVTNMLTLVYDGTSGGDVVKIHAFKDDFDTIRKRIDDQWSSLPPIYNPISKDMLDLQNLVSQGMSTSATK